MRRTPDPLGPAAGGPGDAARPDPASAVADGVLEAKRAQFFGELHQEPYRYDFFQAMRRIETLFPGKPRVGLALRPIDEPVRLAQAPALSFAPATLSGF
ncbi:MAG: tssG, partial [Betaproteobacteria bacterium]|nr:tssG [Betaproteobacteria bacterium]